MRFIKALTSLLSSCSTQKLFDGIEKNIVLCIECPPPRSSKSRKGQRNPQCPIGSKNRPDHSAARERWVIRKRQPSTRIIEFYRIESKRGHPLLMMAERQDSVNGASEHAILFLQQINVEINDYFEHSYCQHSRVKHLIRIFIWPIISTLVDQFTCSTESKGDTGEDIDINVRSAFFLEL